MKKYYLGLFCFALAIQIASAQNTWVQKSSFGGVGRMGAVAFSIGEKGYLGTGGDWSSSYYDDFWEYDPATDSWTQKADFPASARYRAIGFSTDIKGYVGTGYNNNFISDDLWEYDPLLNIWTQKSNVGNIGRLGAVSFVIGSKAYVGTGAYSAYLKDFWEYNTVTDVWTQKADFGGNEKIYATGFSIGPNGYLGTGAENSNTGVGTKDFWQYDTTTNSWIQKSDLPGSGRSEAVGFSIGGYGYIGTGTSYWGVGALSDFWRYDPLTDSWINIADYPGGAVEEATGLVIGCKAYVGTGFTDDNSNTVKKTFWEYTPLNDCSLAPGAASQVSDSSLCEVTCVGFTDQSTNNPTSWEWSFPGGTPSSSTLQNPSNICYYTAGIYDVTLIVSNSVGSDTLVMSSYITVNAAPTVTITQMNDSLYSSAGNSYQWYSGGNAISGATDFFYTPSSEGFYSVVITDSIGCTASDIIFFSLAPQTSFIAEDTSICEKFCMDFFDQSTNDPTGWQWIFNGGSPSTSSQQNPTQICFNNPGVYDVTLITTNAFGNDTLMATNYITIYSTPPIPTITHNGNVLTCSPADSYQWQLNSLDIPGATMQSYIYSQSGLYTVFTTDSNGCSNSASFLITGVSELVNESFVSVFPNPSSGSFTVELVNGFMDEVSIDVVNILGQIIFSSSEHNYSSPFKKIDLENVASGIYFIEIRTGNDGVSPDSLIIREKMVVAK